jgi:hypothetical protein
VIGITLEFAHEYEVELVRELPPAPGLIEQFHYPGASKEVGGGDFILKVVPRQREPWLGTFSPGVIDPLDPTVVSSCPHDLLTICVIAEGRAYFVKADEPTRWEEIGAGIKDFHVIPQKRLLLFVELTRLVAYGPQGKAWATPDLSFDLLRITEISQDFVRGMAWDAPKQEEVEFFVDLETGRCEGGSSSQLYERGSRRRSWQRQERKH